MMNSDVKWGVLFVKSILIILLFLIFPTLALTQPTGYYNGSEGKEGLALKDYLHNLVKNHRVIPYYDSKNVFKHSDADPSNPNNVILVYTGRSQLNTDYGTGGNDINREHVWAKSHGDFDDRPPMYSDVHNLKPCDASVNSSKSNKDFAEGGSQHSEATGCYYTVYTWEPRDEVKGDIARIIFYMSVRYEGEGEEEDLEVVDEINTYPKPEHGKLSDLLAWNIQDPPDDFERNRNEVIFGWQRNRNPFIDHPQFAQLIWGGATASGVTVFDVEINPEYPSADEEVVISCGINTPTNVESAQLTWGTDAGNLMNAIMMEGSGGHYHASIPGQSPGTDIYYQIVANDGPEDGRSPVYHYKVLDEFEGDIVAIYDIQGQQSSSPYIDQVVYTSGVVTAEYGEYYFIQDGTGPWSGLYVYDPSRVVNKGDEIVIKGEIDEYYGMTSISNISEFYRTGAGISLPAPIIVPTNTNEEKYESVWVKVQNATCTDANYQANYDMWKVNDGSGNMLVHNSLICEYKPVKNEIYSVTGPLIYDYGEFKIELNSVEDVTVGPSSIYDYEEINQVHVFPQPALNSFNVSSFELLPGKYAIKIYSSIGEMVWEKSIQSTGNQFFEEIDCQGLKEGIYLLEIKSSVSTFIKKIIIL